MTGNMLFALCGFAVGGCVLIFVAIWAPQMHRSLTHLRDTIEAKATAKANH